MGELMGERVLIVEPDPQVRGLLETILEHYFGQIFSVWNLDSAKKCLQEPYVFDVVLSEYRLFDGTGLDLFFWIRSELKQKIPFLMLSGGLTPVLLSEEAFSFMSKPFPMDRLVKQLNFMIQEMRFNRNTSNFFQPRCE